MDVVYIIRKWMLNNIELLFSLRSLSNIKHDRVFLFGYKPKWVRNVIHIPMEDKWTKYDNVKNKHIAIMNNEEISDDFVYMNDDFYFIIPQEVKYYKIWKNTEHLKYIKRRDKHTKEVWKKVPQYYNNLLKLKKIFGECNDFETHTPIIFNKDKLKALYEKYPDYPTTALRTMYCNEYKIKGYKLPKTPNYKWYKEKLCDCKIYLPKDLIVKKWQPLLSSENKIAMKMSYYNFMTWLFPEKSYYEHKYININLLKHKYGKNNRSVC
jgi:hypothetical protein